jgi:hypothetical protein
MEFEQKDTPNPSIMIRVTHIRDGEVLEVIETQADEIHFDMKEAGNGCHE